MPHRLPLLVLLAALAVGCAPAAFPSSGPATSAVTADIASPPPAAPAAPPVTPSPRPEAAPDVVLFAVSGRCPTLCGGEPAANYEYLVERGTVAALVRPFEARGLRVETRAYSAHPGARHVSWVSRREEFGAAKLEADVLAAWRDLVANRANPARLVLVGHSHGVVWTHAFAERHPEVPIDVLIDLDGVCLQWGADQRRAIRAGLRDGAAERACDLRRVGRRWARGKDVVPPNVRLNLEVQSRRVGGATKVSPLPNVLFDTAANVRPDGGRAGIETFLARRDGHGAVARPDSDTMKWVLARLDAWLGSER